MTKDGAAGLAGWLESTWMPYLERLDPVERPAFQAQFEGMELRGLAECTARKLCDNQQGAKLNQNPNDAINFPTLRLAGLGQL